MTGASLLDVNLLVALFNPDHVHHDLAHDWFADHRELGWATCPKTENGFVRVLSNPASGAPVVRAADLIERLRAFCASGGHEFWGDEVSLTDRTLFRPALLAGHKQVTDVYLLGLVVRHGGRLATFDRTIPLSAVIGAREAHLHVIAPA